MGFAEIFFVGGGATAVRGTGGVIGRLAELRTASRVAHWCGRNVLNLRAAHAVILGARQKTIPQYEVDRPFLI